MASTLSPHAWSRVRTQGPGARVGACGSVFRIWSTEPAFHPRWPDSIGAMGVGSEVVNSAAPRGCVSRAGAVIARGSADPLPRIPTAVVAARTPDNDSGQPRVLKLPSTQLGAAHKRGPRKTLPFISSRILEPHKMDLIACHAAVASAVHRSGVRGHSVHHRSLISVPFFFCISSPFPRGGHVI